MTYLSIGTLVKYKIFYWGRLTLKSKNLTQIIRLAKTQSKKGFFVPLTTIFITLFKPQYQNYY